MDGVSDAEAGEGRFEHCPPLLTLHSTMSEVGVEEGGQLLERSVHLQSTLHRRKTALHLTPLVQREREAEERKEMGEEGSMGREAVTQSTRRR